MLPSSKKSLQNGGMSSTGAAFTMIGCFLGGVIGIQLISWALHRLIPSQDVDCDHTHKGSEGDQDHENPHQGGHSNIEDQAWTDDRLLLSRDDHDFGRPKQQLPTLSIPEIQQGQGAPRIRFQNGRMSSLRTLHSFLLKSRCGEDGPCHGYSNPCGNECYRVVSQNRDEVPIGQALDIKHDHHGLRIASSTTDPNRLENSNQLGEETPLGRPCDWGKTISRYGALQSSGQSCKRSASPASETSSQFTEDDPNSQHSEAKNSIANHHHHHVASNAFLSIGLQTSIAIALHKLPEGFITYATNHANPKLGFTIFVALTVHNVTEGFALALPLYLAINHRIKAIFWASLLGGASQPLGAGIAVLWFRVAQSRDMVPSEGVYGVMFAITSGIMTSVALQLFSESLTLMHNKAFCMAFAFVGMGILGLSNALTA